MAPVYQTFSGRRPTREVRIGSTGVGGSHPIRIQSMLTSDTMNTEACVAETLGLAEAGCEIVRITAPTVKDAKNLGVIRSALKAAGCTVPLVADIHFKPEAAMEAALWVDKVRINPGNFSDSKKFATREYSDAEYEAEIGRIRDRFSPLVKLCKERGVAMRIGTNHGSLSDRIMNRYGDTPLGMVESALEFARIAREHDYHELIFSMKASNPKVMIQAYRLLVARLEALNESGSANEKSTGNEPRTEGISGIPHSAFPISNSSHEKIDSHGSCEVEERRHPKASGIPHSAFPISNSSWNYPIHLGVTEAGDSEDGRIKSAIGIGSLLLDGIGDTIRVSLTEDSIHEIPVARALARLADSRRASPSHPIPPPCDPFAYSRRASCKVAAGDVPAGGGELVRVGVCRPTRDRLSGKLPAMGTSGPSSLWRMRPRWRSTRRMRARSMPPTGFPKRALSPSPGAAGWTSSRRSGSWPHAWMPGIRSSSRMFWTTPERNPILFPAFLWHPPTSGPSSAMASATPS